MAGEQGSNHPNFWVDEAVINDALALVQVLDEDGQKSQDCSS